MRQGIKLLLGGYCAIIFANFFLFHYEYEWLEKIKRRNNVLARKFGNTFRFIDEVFALNDVGAIYPSEVL